MSHAVEARRVHTSSTDRDVGQTWSRSRVVGGLVLCAWGAMFWFLFLTGRVNLYLSTRTSWVVPVGAVLLSFAGIGRLAAARARRIEQLTRREATVKALLILPVILVLALLPATLGTFSAPKKAAFSAVSFASGF